MRQCVDAGERDLLALAAFEREGLGHDRHGQDAHFLRELGDHGRCAGTGAAAHAAGDEDHVGAGQDLAHAFAIFHRGLLADFRIGAGAEALGDIAAELDRGLGRTVAERLRVGVGADELHALDAGIDHVCDRVAAAAAHANDLDDRVRCWCFDEFKHFPTSRCCFFCHDRIAVRLRFRISRNACVDARRASTFNLRTRPSPTCASVPKASRPLRRPGWAPPAATDACCPRATVRRRSHAPGC